jgi:uncharacterized protein
LTTVKLASHQLRAAGASHNARMTTASALLVHRLAQRLHAELVETHISWVLLAGEFAYKLKKPVRLPFVDYSSAEQRRHFCAEEVRLNQRLAPALYLGVSRVTGPAEAPAIDGAGETLDYAVRMRRFPAGALFSERALAGTLDASLVDRLAERIAAFHLAAPVCSEPEPGAGTLSQRTLAALQAALPPFAPGLQALLRDWISARAAEVDVLWVRRRAEGHARDGHGDLHLSNLLALDGDVVAFDCIEFDAGLRCIDVIEDVAFTLMDFAACGQPAAGWRFLDAWLERTGEYEGLPGLPMCLVYRALVRTMAAQLREPLGADARRYAGEALRWTTPAQPRLVITHGLPGSGKTHASQRLLEREGAIRIRSDVERKRLHGLDRLADSRASGVALYTPEATARTYDRLLALAGPLLRAGLTVVLDAAFLRVEERRQARAVAEAAGVPFAILACEAPEPILRERLLARTGDASEADVGVLGALSCSAEPLQPDEALCVIGSPLDCGSNPQ